MGVLLVKGTPADKVKPTQGDPRHPGRGDVFGFLALPLRGPRLTLGHGLLSDHGEMPKKVTVIVPRTAPALFAYLKEKFSDDRTISVIMDRRIAERRRLNETPRTERRQSDRRRSGRDYAIVVSES